MDHDSPNEEPAMTPEQANLETVAWDVDVVDAEVKLYLLALVRSTTAEEALRISGLSAGAARSARGWLREVGVLREDGTLDAARLRSARATHLSVNAA
jgi:hypothetical protein